MSLSSALSAWATLPEREGKGQHRQAIMVGAFSERQPRVLDSHTGLQVTQGTKMGANI